MMFSRSGVSLGKYFGIPVQLHPTWFIILVVMTVSYTGALAEETGISRSLAFVGALLGVLAGFLSLLAHEFGHALAARYFGIPTDRISLFLFGGVAEVRSEPKTPWQEFFIAAAGPAVSLVLMVLFGALAYGLRYTSAPPWVELVVWVVAQMNMVFGVFNLLPGFPMDGGRVLRAALWGMTGKYLTSTRIAARGGQLIGWLIIGFGAFQVMGGNLGGLMVVLTGFFLKWLAQTAYRQSQLRAAFEAVSVGDLMRPVEVAIPAGTTLRGAVRQFFNRIGGDRYPVVRGAELVGYLSADDLAAQPLDQWDAVPVERLARSWTPKETLNPQMPGLEAFTRLGQLGVPRIAVFHERNLVGFVHGCDITRYLDQFVQSTRF